MTSWLTPGRASRSLTVGLTPADVAPIDTALEAHHAPATLTTYASAWRGFERYCANRGSVPLPAAPEVICAYITSQAERGLTSGTVTCTLAAIAHRLTGAPEIRLFYDFLLTKEAGAGNPATAPIISAPPGSPSIR